MLSGSVGSSKSTALTDAIVDHVLNHERANLGIGRLSLPSLKGTLCESIREHLYGTGITYKFNETSGAFKFPNGSKITPFSWSDKKYKKFRSHELSAMAFEELTENDGDHKNAYLEAVGRVGRIAHIKESWVGSATNPDAPSHWAYNHFIMSNLDRRKVYYSSTADNPFLPDHYIDGLLDIYDEKMAQRMIYGKWIEIMDEMIYYTYDRKENFKDVTYQVDPRHPIYVCYDFNISEGKPLSVAFHQHIDGVYHVFNEVVVDGQRSEESLIEAQNRGLMDHPTTYYIHGDRNGNNRNTAGPGTDYSVIENWLKRNKIRYKMEIPRENPRLRDRHNIVNGRICNAKGARHLFVYKDAPTVDEGLRLTSLKRGANYLENDSIRSQHITTGLGYSICMIEKKKRYQSSSSGVITMRGGRRL